MKKSNKVALTGEIRAGSMAIESGAIGEVVVQHAQQAEQSAHIPMVVLTLCRAQEQADEASAGRKRARRAPGLQTPESLGTGDITTLGREAIHSVLNPLGKMSCAIHGYGGDFFAPPEQRSMWDHETLIEPPWNVERVKAVFAGAEARFNAWPQAQSGQGR